jgi:nucleolar protein 56
MNPRVFVVKAPIGIFSLSNGEIIYYELFSKDAHKAVEQFLAEVPESFLRHLEGYEIAEGGEKVLRKNIRSFAIDLGFVGNDEEFNTFISEFSALLSKKKMKSSASRDKLIIQASNALEDISKIQNLFMERLREW